MLLGVLTLRFEKLNFLCDSIGFLCTSWSSLHRSRTGIISLWDRPVISDLCMLFDLVPATRSLVLQRPSELNSGKWWSNNEWHQFSDALFFTESECDVGNAPACDSNSQCHLCGDWFSSTKGRSAHLRAKHAVISDGKLFANGCGCCPCCKVTRCSRPGLSAHPTDSRRSKCLEWCRSNATPKEADGIQRLDIIDRALGSQARRSGHTQPRSTVRDVGQDGRKTGRFVI